MDTLNKLNDLLDDLFRKEAYMKSELVKHQRMAQFASVQIQILRQKLNQKPSKTRQKKQKKPYNLHNVILIYLFYGSNAQI